MAPAQKARVQGSIRLVGLPALIILLGLQTLRVFIPSVAWYLKDTLGLGIGPLALIAMGTVLTGFLAPIIRRAVGADTALLIAAGGMAAFRLVEQIVFSPRLDIWLSMAGASLFSMSLPLLSGHIRTRSGPLQAQRLAYGWITGFALDSAIRGATWTLDLSWIPGIIPILFVAGIGAVMLWLLTSESRIRTRAPDETGWRNAIPLLALGPMLFLQAIALQNQGWISEIADLSGGIAFLVVMLGNTLAALGAIWAFGHPQSFHPLLGLAGIAVSMPAVCACIPNPFLTLILLALNQVLWGWGLALIGTVSTTVEQDGLLHTGWSSVGALALFLCFAFLYYAALEIYLPIPRAVFPAAAAAVFGLILIYASLRARLSNLIARANNYMALPVALIIVVPLLQLLGQTLLPPSTPEPMDTIRVMTYNIHSAYDPSGRQNPEAIATLVERSGAQIIGLQEVSRGWLINGSTDLPAWFSNRLGMKVLFQGTSGPMWGNALLTQLPIIEHGRMPLPGDGALIDRGLIWARLAAPGGEPVLVIVTHLHHVPSEGEIRLRQISSLLDRWHGRSRIILMGDLNAQPGTEAVRQLRRAGLQDAWESGGAGPGLTFPSTGPQRRIDWIWFSPEFQVTQAEIIQSQASDHLPLIAEAQE